MKDINRIHLAQVPYNIEHDAANDLAKYLNGIETAFRSDADDMREIELRMTELLAERGIRSDGVITTADVTAIKQQLGEPEDFRDDKATDNTVPSGPRRLMRDPSTGVLGGVLSGFGEYFGIQPLWLRLGFVVLALGSFGSFLLVYLILWAVMPAVRSAADRLQLEGKPVTLSTLRDIAESGQTAIRESRLGSIIIFLFGALLAMAALGSLGVTIAGGIGIPLNRPTLFGSETGMSNWPMFAAYGSAILAGLLLTSLLAMGAYATLTRKITKRLGFTTLGLVIVGLAAAGSAAGLVGYQFNRYHSYVQEHTQKSELAVPADWTGVTGLVVSSESTRVHYVVSSDKPHAVYEGYADNGRLPSMSVTRDGAVVTVAMKQTIHCPVNFCTDISPGITVFGPALANLTGKRGTIDYQPMSQPQLMVIAEGSADVRLYGGSITNLMIEAQAGGRFSATDTVTTNVTARPTADSSIELGRIASLNLLDPVSCTSGDKGRVEVEAIGQPTIKVNGADQPAVSKSYLCTRLELQTDNDAQTN